MQRQGGAGASVLLGAIALVGLGAFVALAASVAPPREHPARSSNRGQDVVKKKKKKKQPRTGMPNPLGPVWFSLTNDFTGANRLPHALGSGDALNVWSRVEVHQAKSDVFAEHEGFVEAVLLTGHVSENVKEQIERDIPRTFPDEELLLDQDVRDSMRRVLTAVALEFPDVAYVQSMNFVCAFLLLFHCKTEDACFCLMRRAIEHPRLRLDELYGRDFPLLNRLMAALDSLILNRHPALHAHLSALGVEPLMWAQTPAMTLFTYAMDFETVSNIWTAFFARGWEVIVRVLLYAVQASHDELLQCREFENAVVGLRNLCGPDAPPDIMSRADALVLTDRDMEFVHMVLPNPGT